MSSDGIQILATKNARHCLAVKMEEDVLDKLFKAFHEKEDEDQCCTPDNKKTTLCVLW